MENYLQNLFENDNIGFKTTNKLKESTKVLVIKLNHIVKNRDGQNITNPEILKLVDDVKELNKKIEEKRKLIQKKISDKSSNQKGGGGIEAVVTETSTIDLLKSINNNPCAGAITQCADIIKSCGQTGGALDKNIEDEAIFMQTLNTYRQFDINEKNTRTLFNLAKILSL